jgi:dimethylhistidine N-methyltransferase
LAIVRPPGTHSAESFAEAIRAGLSAQPKTLPCRYFYDDAGSRLFERICELPEYYLTRTEDAILREHAEAMVAGWPRAPLVIELGSGSSVKTRRLLAAGLARYGRLHYQPIDVSARILEESAEALVHEFPGLRVTGWAGDYRLALTTLERTSSRPKLVLFLGSSLGNYEPDEAIGLLQHIATGLRSEDRLLLGTDLAKDRATLEAAYDDAQGVTAAFNRNLLVRINRELGADFDSDGFDHVARYRPELGRVEMHLVSRQVQTVTIPAAAITIVFAEEESIHTESSHKYTLSDLASLAARAGFVEEQAWTDPRRSFRVQRWRPAIRGVGAASIGHGIACHPDVTQ